jgi:hypothetical protein
LEGLTDVHPHTHIPDPVPESMARANREARAEIVLDCDIPFVHALRMNRNPMNRGRVEKTFRASVQTSICALCASIIHTVTD